MEQRLESMFLVLLIPIMNWILVAPTTISVSLQTEVIQRSARTDEQRSTIEETLYVLPHMMHYGIVGIGNPLQYFKLIFDTGSSTIWVANSERDAAMQMIQNSYNPLYSDAPLDTGVHFSAQYGSYEAHGYVASDVVYLHDWSFCSLFGVVDYVSGDLKQFHLIDGLFGLAPGQLHEELQETPLDIMWTQGLISERVFSFMFNQDKRAGTLLFGEVPSSQIIGPVNWVPIINNSEVKNNWVVRMKRTFFRKDLGLTTGLIALVDTGNFMTSLPRRFLKSFVINSLVTVVGDVITVPCSLMHTLPRLVFEFEGFKLYWYPQQYVLQTPEGVCHLTLKIMQSDATVDVILGMAFLQDYTTIFDVERRQVGFAQLVS